MMDEFAQYAKTERKINKLTENLNQCSSARSLQVFQIWNEIVWWSLMKNSCRLPKRGGPSRWACMPALVSPHSAHSISRGFKFKFWFQVLVLWWLCGLGEASLSWSYHQAGSLQSLGDTFTSIHHFYFSNFSWQLLFSNALWPSSL